MEEYEKLYKKNKEKARKTHKGILNNSKTNKKFPHLVGIKFGKNRVTFEVLK